ncbi:hypothetical protein [Algoriphagus terrigena]|uniref:hypothetical protein n=1 Tax=Algoriphagus terrigena TaxID=344884 RepID=UPI0003F5FF0B|nr:hypothetical protein [Algoriphagus terrigena]
MDLGNIVYIAAVIGYFIYQATRKKRGQELPEQGNAEPDAPKKGMSFEDLLKEIREAQSPPVPERQAQPKQQIPVPSPAATVHREKPVSRRPVLVEKDDEEARYYEGTYAASKSNVYQASKDIHSFQPAPAVKFDYSSVESKRVNPYAELLKNPKTLRQSMVVSEILRPKYF